MVIPPAIGVILILIGIVLFIVDLSVTNHALLTAGGIVMLLSGGLAFLGAIVVVAMLMGGVLSGSWVLCAPPTGGRRLRARR